MTANLNPPRLLQTIPGDARYGMDGRHCVRRGFFLPSALSADRMCRTFFSGSFRGSPVAGADTPVRSF
jgi:hypothetical protein